ncbi:MAG: phage virion morphogenesis protein [Syntrophales bacterium]|jgi:phage virion morphogenesis protein|nr:phage virion morphogenesis protein [Syntrophales bacterium]
MRIKVDIQDRAVRDALAELARRGRDNREMMLDIGEVVRTSVEDNFEAQGRPERWKQSGRVVREGGQTLSKSARLRRSFTVAAENGCVTVGTNVECAAIHQFGGKTKPHTIVPRPGKALYWPGAAHPVRVVKHPGSDIPARPFLMVQDEDWEEIRHIAFNYLTGKW